MDSRPLLILLLAFNAQAATVADSLVCESVSDLEFVNRQNELKGQPGSVVMTRAKASVEFYRLHAETARMIYIPKTRSDQVEKSEQDAYKSLVAGCAAFSGPVTVLERKAISGLAKVRVTYEGRPAELWTFSAGLTE